MKDLLEKISSYNIFNYLFPGVVFVVFAHNFTKYNLIQSDILTGVFVYYFIGLVISRIGSLIIVPILKSIKFLKFADYKLFVQKSKVDEKIDLFSETSNMYRTICSIFVTLGIIKLYEWLSTMYPFLDLYKIGIISLFLFILFLFSYRKQSNFITKRIEANQ